MSGDNQRSNNSSEIFRRIISTKAPWKMKGCIEGTQISGNAETITLSVGTVLQGKENSCQLCVLKNV